MNILIDSREQHRIEYAKKTYKQHDIETKYLETADYIFNQEVAFEYKTLPDFINSVQSGRVFEQAIRLNQEFKYPFVMIQGSEQELDNYINKLFFMRKTKKHNKPQKFYKKNYYGAIERLNTYATVLERPTEHQAFQSMLNQAKMSLETGPVNRKVAKTGSPAYLCLRYCIRGVGPKTAEKIVNTLKLESVEDVLNVSVSDFVSVNGVSLGKAELFYSKLHS